MNNISPLKDRTISNLNDGINLSDKNKSIFSVVKTTVNVISVSPKIPKNKYKLIICTDVDEDLYVYKHCGKLMTLSPSWTPIPRFILLFGVRLYTKSNSNNILILPQQSPNPLARLFFKLSTKIGVLSVKSEQYGQCTTSNFVLIMGIPKLIVIDN